MLQKTVEKHGHLHQHLPVGNARKGTDKEMKSTRNKNGLGYVVVCKGIGFKLQCLWKVLCAIHYTSLNTDKQERAPRPVAYRMCILEMQHGILPARCGKHCCKIDKQLSYSLRRMKSRTVQMVLTWDWRSQLLGYSSVFETTVKEVVLFI